MDRSGDVRQSPRASSLRVFAWPRLALVPIARQSQPTGRQIFPHWLWQTVRGGRRNRSARSCVISGQEHHVIEKSRGQRAAVCRSRGCRNPWLPFLPDKRMVRVGIFFLEKTTGG